MRDWSTLRSREWQPTGATESIGSGGGGSTGSRAAGPDKTPSASESVTVASTGPGASASTHEHAAGERKSAESVSVLGLRSKAKVKEAENIDDVNSLGKKKDKSSKGFATDTSISSSKSKTFGQPRELKKWDDPDAHKYVPVFETDLEPIDKSKKKKPEGFDQFKVNYEKFGVVSTFKEDLSQYTTILDRKNITKETRERADRIAKDIEAKGRGPSGLYGQFDDDGAGSDGDGDEDEEGRFSAVPRDWDPGATSSSRAPASSDKGAGGALLAVLRAADPAEVGTDVSGISDYRSLVAPKVQAWWRARIAARKPSPLGAENSLVCPFSQKVFGDVSQLVMYWAAELPGKEGAERAKVASGPPREGAAAAAIADEAEVQSAVTKLFQSAGLELRWSEMVASTGLGATFTVDEPRPGSVWAQLLERLKKRSQRTGELIEERPVDDFVNEALLMRCWRRDQKIEHRELLEGLAAGLALHILDSGAWHPERVLDRALT